MIEVIKIEMYKIYKSKSWIFSIILLSLIIIISFFTTYYAPQGNGNYALYIYYFFAINSRFLVEVLVITFFTPILVNEYSSKTIKILFASKFKREKIYLGKYIAAAICFVCLYLIMFMVYFIFSAVFYISVNSIEQLIISLQLDNMLLRIIIILISECIYLISFGGLIFIISLVSKSKVLTFLISVVILIFYMLIPLPEWSYEYIFFRSGQAYTTLAMSEFPIKEIFKLYFVNIGTLIAFLGLGGAVIEHQQIK